MEQKILKCFFFFISIRDNKRANETRLFYFIEIISVHIRRKQREKMIFREIKKNLSLFVIQSKLVFIFLRSKTKKKYYLKIFKKKIVNPL